MRLQRPSMCFAAISAIWRFSGSERKGNSPVPPHTATMWTLASSIESMCVRNARSSTRFPPSANGVQIGTQMPLSWFMQVSLVVFRSHAGRCPIAASEVVGRGLRQDGARRRVGRRALRRGIAGWSG